MIHVYENLYIDVDPCQYILREDTGVDTKNVKKRIYQMERFGILWDTSCGYSCGCRRID